MKSLFSQVMPRHKLKYAITVIHNNLTRKFGYVLGPEFKPHWNNRQRKKATKKFWAARGVSWEEYQERSREMAEYHQSLREQRDD